MTSKYFFIFVKAPHILQSSFNYPKFIFIWITEILLIFWMTQMWIIHAFICWNAFNCFTNNCRFLFCKIPEILIFIVKLIHVFNAPSFYLQCTDIEFYFKAISKLLMRLYFIFFRLYIWWISQSFFYRMHRFFVDELIFNFYK